MEVILKEDVPKLGNRGEVVKVAEGYGRNFLLPKKLAIEATVANKTVIEQMKAAAVRRSAKEKTEAEALAKQFDGLEVKFLRKSGEGDQLFGSVTAGDIAEALEKKSFHIDRRKIQLHEPLKTVGEFIVPIKLHKDVTTHLKVVVDKESSRIVCAAMEGTGDFPVLPGGDARRSIIRHPPQRIPRLFSSLLSGCRAADSPQTRARTASSKFGCRAAPANRGRAAIESIFQIPASA